MNDRADLCLPAEFGGVHVGQDDLSPESVRKIIGPTLCLGVSTHNPVQVVEADQTSADYIAVGPVFGTSSKANPDPVIGLEGVRQARALTRKPLVAIGGITRANCRSVIDAGADSVAVISDLINCISQISRGIPAHLAVESGFTSGIAGETPALQRNQVSIESKPSASSDWDLHTHQDKDLIQGLGLTSATMLVMGSMIGSGIFIVSADIARQVDSPALLIGAWLVTGGHDHHRGSELRRTRRHDAASRWTICLFARGARARCGDFSMAGRCFWSSKPEPLPP